MLQQSHPSPHESASGLVPDSVRPPVSFTKPPLTSREANKTTIAIQNLSDFGVGSLLVGPVELVVSATSHAPGGIHTISVHFIAQVSGQDVDFLLSYARTGEYFIQVEWTFPDHRRPKFTTRHVLSDTGEDTADLSFSGGLDFAVRLFDHYQSFQAASLSARQQPQSPSTPFQPGSQPMSQKLSCQYSGIGSLGSARGRDWLETGALPSQGVPYHFPQTRRSASPLTVRGDQFLDCPSPTPAATLREDVEMAPLSSADHSDLPIRQPSPDWMPDDGNGENCEDTSEDWDYLDNPDPPGLLSDSEEMAEAEQSVPGWRTESASEWAQREILQQKRQEAEALFARNGDPSGLLAVQQLARQFAENWHPMGVPYF